MAKITSNIKTLDSAGQPANGIVFWEQSSEYITDDGRVTTARGELRMKDGVLVGRAGGQVIIPPTPEGQIVSIEESFAGSSTIFWTTQIPADSEVDYADLPRTVPPATGVGIPSWVTELLAVPGAVVGKLELAEAAAAASQQSRDEAAAFGGTNNSQVATFVTAPGPTKDALSGTFVTIPDAMDSGYDIVLIAGQSNAQGDSGGAISPVIDVTDPRIWAFGGSGAYSGQIVQASDPLAHQGGVGSTVVGPGMSFARWYAGMIKGNRRVLLVPAAMNGTAFGSGTKRWDPTRTRDANNLYEGALVQAQAALSSAGPGSRIIGILWVQGESDAINSSMPAATYRSFLESLIDGYRARLGLPNLPFVIGSMTPEFVGSVPAGAVIDAVHVATPNRKPYTSFVRGPSGLGRGDNLHYSPAGQREQGRRLVGGLAAALLNVSPAGAVPASPPSIAEATVPGVVTNLVATGSIASAQLTWSAPVVNYAAPVTDYLVQYRLAGGSGWTTFAHAASAATQITVTGLTNYSAYDFQIAAVNSVGAGAVSSISTATPTGPIASLTDNFNRSDTANGLGSTAEGVAWQILSGTWGISSNAAYTSATLANSIAIVDNHANDYTVQATIATRDNGSTLLWRCTDTDNWYGLFISSGASAPAIYKKVAGVTTAIAGSIPSGLANGDVFKVVVSGSNFTVFRNGTQIGTFTDSALPTGKPGIRSEQNSGRWDAFSVTAP